MAETIDEDEITLSSEQLDAIAALHRDSRTAFIDTVESHSWRPAAKSQALADEADMGRLDPNENIADHLSGFDLFVEVAVTQLEIASLHIHGMAALYDARWVFLTPDVVARSTIEALGHAIWVLGTSKTTSRQRLARAYLLHVGSARRDKDLDALRRNPGELASARLREARARCKKVFPTSATRLLDKGQLDSEETPGLTAMVKMFFEVATANDAIIAEKGRTDAIYGYLSTAAHPTLFRVREVRRILGGSTATELRADAVAAQHPALLTSMLFYVVLRSFVNYFGYPPGRCEQLAEHIDKVFPGAMVD